LYSVTARLQAIEVSLGSVSVPTRFLTYPLPMRAAELQPLSDWAALIDATVQVFRPL